MSWFRRIPHPPGQTRKYPHHTSAMAGELEREIDANRERLEQHRQDAQKEPKDGKLHRQ